MTSLLAARAERVCVSRLLRHEEVALSLKSYPLLVTGGVVWRKPRSSALKENLNNNNNNNTTTATIQQQQQQQEVDFQSEVGPVGHQHKTSITFFADICHDHLRFLANVSIP